MSRGPQWTVPLTAGRSAQAWQRPDGMVVIHATDEEAIATARFMLALDDDTSGFHERFDRDPLLGPSARAHVGFRPLRRATVAQALLRAMCGQLIEARRAITIERSLTRATGAAVVTQEALTRFSAAELRTHGLAQHRATALARIVRTIDLESLRRFPTDVVSARLTRERAIGPWSVGVIAMEGLGRYDHGIVGDLSLVKLAASLWKRWPEPSETATLLAPYGEWQGLACEILLRGWAKGLVPGADPDRARSARRRSLHAA
jgi:3-methyladenine DNA glycosylase/8-oxoguanine DNA glycosylase